MNPIRKLHFYPPVLILALLLSRTQPAIAITIDELADICQTMESAFTDITVEYEWSFEPAPSLQDMPTQDILIQKGPAKRKWSSKHPFTEIFLTTERVTLANSNGNSFESTIMQSYDGKTAKQLTIGALSPTGEQVDISDGVITKSARFKQILNGIPIAFSILRLGLDHEKVPLSERLRKKEFVRLDDSIKNVNGFNAICIELLWDAPSVPILHKKEPELRIYFSIDNGYTPIKFDNLSHSKSGPEVNFSVNVTSLEKVSDNLWFPSKGSLGDNPTNIYQAIKILVNQGLTDEYFDIEFPPGTRITNEISGLSYVSEVPEDQNDTVTNSTIQDSEPVIEAQRPQPPADTQKSNKTILYISIAAVIVLLTTLIVKKCIDNSEI
jgi:hypothetical protein